jgi:uncharacterized protein (DUF2147 family)
MRHSFILIASVLTLCSLMAQASPVGLWKTIDDTTKQERSLVRIVEKDGVLTGSIEKLLITPTTPNCVKCTDDRRDAPLQGLTILRQIKPTKKASVWEGGDILDPKSGSLYKVRLTEINEGRELEVRGYFGVSLLGRTQVWQRME